jgi:hypothetical protein
MGVQTQEFGDIGVHVGNDDLGELSPQVFGFAYVRGGENLKTRALDTSEIGGEPAGRLSRSEVIVEDLIVGAIDRSQAEQTESADEHKERRQKGERRKEARAYVIVSETHRFASSLLASCLSVWRPTEMLAGSA